MVYFWFKKCVFILVSLCLQLYWLRAVQFNARSACDASMFTSCIYIFLRLASKCLNCTRSPEEIVQKLHKYDWKHKINSLKIDSDNFTKLPVTFLVENNTENRVKFAKFFNILLNFSLWLCVVQVAWHNFKRFSLSTDNDKISLAFEISKFRKPMKSCRRHLNGKTVWNYVRRPGHRLLLYQMSIFVFSQGKFVLAIFTLITNCTRDFSQYHVCCAY